MRVGVVLETAQIDARQVGIARPADTARGAPLLGVVLLAQGPQGGGALGARVVELRLRGRGFAVAPRAVGGPSASATAQSPGGCDLDDAVDVFEQLAVVARDHGNATPRGQLCAQPAPCVDIEVVGGLVEQQGIGPREEGAEQRRARALAAAQAFGALMRHERESRGGKRRGQARGQVPAAFDVVEISGRSTAGLDAFECCERPFQAGKSGHGPASGAVAMCCGTCASRADRSTTPALGRAWPRQQRHEPRLARAVVPHEADAARLEGLVDVVEQQPAFGQHEADMPKLERRSRRCGRRIGARACGRTRHAFAMSHARPSNEFVARRRKGLALHRCESGEVQRRISGGSLQEAIGQTKRKADRGGPAASWKASRPEGSRFFAVTRAATTPAPQTPASPPPKPSASSAPACETPPR
jgi:hypothetical protein